MNEDKLVSSMKEAWGEIKEGDIHYTDDNLMQILFRAFRRLYFKIYF